MVRATGTATERCFTGAVTESLPMFKSVHQELLVDTLLNSLEAERYVRGPLLLTLVDELSAAHLRDAAATARALLVQVETTPMSDETFFEAITELRQMVASEVPSSGFLARTAPPPSVSGHGAGSQSAA